MKKMRLLEAVLGSGTHGEGTEESSQDSVNVVIKPLSDKILQWGDDTHGDILNPQSIQGNIWVRNSTLHVDWRNSPLAKNGRRGWDNSYRASHVNTRF